MAEGSQRWRRRTAALMALLHAGYVLLVVWFVVWGMTELGREYAAGDAGTQLTLWVVIMALIAPLLTGLAVVSPVLVWLIVLAVGLWRGRRWARVGGIVTFAIAAVALAVAGFGGGVDEGSQAFFGILMPAPSLVGLGVLLTGAASFPPKDRPVAAAPVAT